MSDSAVRTSIELSLQHDYRFEVDFKAAGVPLLQTDAGPPLGAGEGPDSEKLLLAAVANCLSASLLFSLRKYRNDAPPMRASARAELAPNAQGRTRVGRIDVDIHLGVPAAELRLLDRALAQYEDFCVVTQSVRVAIPVGVRVFDGDGALLRS